MGVKYSLGIDPGWKNAGVSLVREDKHGLHLVKVATINPSLYDPKEITNVILTSVKECKSYGLDYFTMERYVSYHGVQTAESENILMLIGALREAVLKDNPHCEVNLVRAIEWKTELVKLLVKNKGFDNPSTSWVGC